MANQELHLQSLLNTCVRDAKGRSIGRIHEVVTIRQGGEWLVKEYHIGTPALLERFSVSAVGRAIMRHLGANKQRAGFCISWDQIDFSDIERPCLKCEITELKNLSLDNCA